MEEKAQGGGVLVRPFRVTQAFIFQTAASGSGSISGKKQSIFSVDAFYGCSQLEAQWQWK